MFMFQNNDQLANQILTELGHPVIRVELDQNALTYIVKKQLDFYQTYQPKRKEATFYVLENQRTINLNDSTQIGVGLVLMPELYSLIQVYRATIFEQLGRRQPINANQGLGMVMNQLQLMKLSLQIPKYTFDFNIKTNTILITPQQKMSGRQYVIYYQSYNDISEVDSYGQQWVFKFQLQNQKLLLGRIRSKYSGVQTPVGPITTDGSNLIQEQQEEVNQLTEELKKKVDNLRDIFLVG